MAQTTLPRQFMRSERIAFGKYQVLARLGQGGMGHVYLAMNSGPAGVQKLVVIKQLREDYATSVAARSMFLDEARIATRLNHPNIVQTNEVVDEFDDLYLVMEFLDGQPLSRILEASHTAALPLVAKLRVLAEALEGLHYAHELTEYDGTPLNVVHRDVSPQNVIVTYDGHVKLVDFGVAKAADAKTVTESGVFKGKVRYASPEQALCHGVDRRADIFGVGTILWEILTGRRLWQDQADASVLIALASGQIPRIREAFADVPAPLEAICTKALANDPKARFQTALEFRDALIDFIGNQGDTAEIGRALAVSFASDRRKLHAVIDSQVKAARDGTGGPNTVRHIPLLAPDSSGSLASEKSLLRSGVALESTHGRSKIPPAEGASRSRTIALAVAGVLALIVGIAFLMPSKHAADASQSNVPAPGDARVHLSLRASPAIARFLLDGRTLPSNPYEGDVPRDDLSHRFSIRADGYEVRDVETRFERDVNLDVTLAALPAPAPPPAVNVTPPPSNPAPAVRYAPRAYTPPPSLIKKNDNASSSKRRIDEDDPYKQ